MAFLTFHQLSIYQVDLFLLLAFFEFLHLNSFKVSNILNHSSAIKSKLALLGLDVTSVDDHRIHCFFKALQKHSPLNVKINSIIDTRLLEQICQTCDRTFQGHVFKVAYLLGFFAFLRLSNLCPHSAASFDILKHLTKGDVFFHNNGVKILIKWSKTLQLSNQAKLISLPLLNTSLCPSEL